MNIKTLTQQAMNLCKNKENAEDAVQNALLYQLEHGGINEAFLSLKVRQCAMNAHRTSQHYCLIGDASEFNTRPIENDYKTFETKHDFDAMLDTLPEYFQRLIPVFVKNDCDAIAAAKESGYSKETFKQMMFRLKQLTVNNKG